jgi:hypothetical protein
LETPRKRRALVRDVSYADFEFLGASLASLNLSFAKTASDSVYDDPWSFQDRNTAGN